MHGWEQVVTQGGAFGLLAVVLVFVGRFLGQYLRDLLARLDAIREEVAASRRESQLQLAALVGRIDEQAGTTRARVADVLVEVRAVGAKLGCAES